VWGTTGRAFKKNFFESFTDENRNHALVQKLLEFWLDARTFALDEWNDVRRRHFGFLSCCH
jgi:hypothetical protein